MNNTGICVGCGNTYVAYRLNIDLPTGRIYCDTCLVHLRADRAIGREPVPWETTASKEGFDAKRLAFARHLYEHGWLSEYLSDPELLASLAK